MNYPKSFPKNYQILEVNNCDRWQVYNRLQSLDLPCHYQSHKSLQVELRSPLVVVQVWSVVRQTKSSRQYLVDFLENCWQQSPISKSIDFLDKPKEKG